MLSDDALNAELKRARDSRRNALALQASCCALVIAALLASSGFGELFLAGASLLAIATVINTLVLSQRSMGQLRQQIMRFQDSRSARRQVEELFAMTDMLQAAEGYEDAGAVLMATSQRMLPDLAGALYIFNNSGDRLDLASSWNSIEGYTPPQALLPGHCWALKRGKPHINDPASQTLCCSHHIGPVGVVEVPMTARGEVHGLLMFGCDAEDSFDRLMEVRRTARALADSMSLALSNIALREKLRTQSLRDPLTGLYNRRYMEDALERYCSLAERSGGSTSVMMIDLDHFKRLNDEHGHAKGDAVLRDVAAQITGALRPSDVVARYGGEELMVILPQCDLDDAVLKAELLRARVEALSEVHRAKITASFGIASIPETSTGPIDLVSLADEALYEAKQAGRNCIRCAEKRGTRPDNLPRLVIPG